MDEIRSTTATLLVDQATLKRIGDKIDTIILAELGLPIQWGIVLRTGRVTPWLSNGGRDVMKNLLIDVINGMNKQEQAQAQPQADGKKQ